MTTGDSNNKTPFAAGLSPRTPTAAGPGPEGKLEPRGAATVVEADTPSTERAPVGERHGLVGEVVEGKYRIDRVIGMGGMGVVVAATHLQLDRPVAIKLVRRDLASDASIVDRLLKEAQSAARIRGEHVARVLDFGTLTDGSPFIVMEYLEGADLATLLHREGPLEAAQAADLLLQACEAVAEAHLCGLVHRDLKPGNLFVARLLGGTPMLKVVDFGISKQIKVNAPAGLTTSPKILGSPNYMAPEQMRGHAVDQRADIWALGSILYELLTGERAFDGETLPGVCQSVLGGRVPRLRDRLPQAPRELEEIILRCLATSPSNRYHSVAELARDLAPFGRRRARLSLENIVAMSESAGPSTDAACEPAPSVAEADQAPAATAVPSQPASSQLASSQPPSSRPPSSQPAASTVSVVPHSVNLSPPPSRRGGVLWAAGAVAVALACAAFFLAGGEGSTDSGSSPSGVGRHEESARTTPASRAEPSFERAVEALRVPRPGSGGADAPASGAEPASPGTDEATGSDPPARQAIEPSRSPAAAVGVLPPVAPDPAVSPGSAPAAAPPANPSGTGSSPRSPPESSSAGAAPSGEGPAASRPPARAEPSAPTADPGASPPPRPKPGVRPAQPTTAGHAWDDKNFGSRL